MSWTSPPGAWGAADPLFLLLIALGAEAYLGGRHFRFAWAGNPRRALAALCLELARRLNRAERPPAARRRRGALVAGALGLGALGLGWLAALLTRHYPFAWTLELFLLILLIDQRATWRLGAGVQEALASGSLVRAREALRPLTVEALTPARVDALDGEAAVAATLGALGRRFAGRLMAPVLWYVVLGLPGLFLQQTSYVMAAALGASRDTVDPHGDPYAEPARSLARAVAFLPDAFGAALLALAAGFVPGGQGWPALRGGLSVGLAGGEVAAQTLRHALAPVPVAARLNRGLVVFAIACLIDAGLIGALALLRLAL